MIPEKIAAEDDRGFLLLHDYDRIASGMAGEILNVKSHGTQAKFGFRIIEHGRSREIFDLGFLFRRNVLAEEFQIFSVDPRRNVAVSDDNRSLLSEDGIPRDVVEVVVSVDDELDGKFRDHAYFAEQGLCGLLVFKRVNHRDAVLTYHEAGVGA